ncbi:MAG: hypothetical protein JWO79_3761 [Actinomycetia bacterium]|nr:hypothetical protein [Actinomycetes bacterium]MDQ1652928.1 hypothetical protein [Cryptosporangiaceae bacterium]
MSGTITRIAAALAVLCGALALAGAPASARGGEASVRHVVIAGVAGLRWSDVSAKGTPALARLTRSGSAGSLSVRSAPSVTCPGEGWLTLGSGTYAALKDPSGLAGDTSCAHRGPPQVSSAGEGATVPAMDELRSLNSELRFGASPGLLGSSGLRCVAAAGPGAALAAADREGHVGQYVPALPDTADSAGEFLGRCPLTIADLGALPEGGDRAGALRDLDRRIGVLDHDRPSGTVLIVAGVAETSARPPGRLHLVLAEGPGFHGGYLRSPSTQRIPYVQLSDLAPTALDLLVDKDLPDEVAGRPLDGGASGRPSSVAATTAALADTDTAAVAQKQVIGWFFVAFGVVALVVLGALTVLIRRRRRGEGAPPAAIRWLGMAALALAAVPGATFAANLVPWWRAPWPGLALAGLVTGFAVLTAGLAVTGPWRAHRTGPALVVAAVTTGIFAADAVTGATLQINSLLGYTPLVAGRFTGFGNISAAAFGAAVMILAALLAFGRPRVQALAMVAAVGIPAIAIDGVPGWGADFGGVLTFVPAFVILGMLASRSRISLLRLVLALAGGIVVVAAIGVADWSRPARDRTHFGRFVATVLDGTAGATVYRKLLTSIDLLLHGWYTLAALPAVVILAVLVFRPPAALRQAYADVPALRLALVSVVVMSAIGFATNDSGVAVPVVAALVAVPMTFALCAGALRGPSGKGGTPDTPVPGVGEPAKVLP